MNFLKLKKKKKSWIPIPATQKRVPEHTDKNINDRIRQNTEARVSAFSYAGREAIDKRLEQLDREWDIERAIEANGSVLLLTGLGLGALFSKKWLILPALVGGFCLQHAIQGWCPPIEAFRRMGVRTAREIEEERNALKALRGDFDEISGPQKENGDVSKIISAFRR